MTPADLSRPGWCYRPGRQPSTLVAAGEQVASEQIAGVVTRLAWISELELAHIVPGDRAYVASEMGALLLAWLADLDCPVANRPGPTCLCGPFWRHELWVAEAARLGLPIEPPRRVIQEGDADPTITPPAESAACVTTVGSRCFGDADETLLEATLQLAEATGVETVTAHFSDSAAGARLLTASPWPVLEDEVLALALLDHLGRASSAVGLAE